MVKALPRPVLQEPIDTGNYILRPMTSKYEVWKINRKIYADEELQALLEHRQKPFSTWQLWRRVRQPNPRRRFHHAVVEKVSGKVIGYHLALLLEYRRATLEVVIFDREFWGKGVVVEIRKTLFVALYEHTNIRCLTSHVSSRNFASILNYKKLGFDHVGTVFSAGYDELRNQPVDMLMMTLLGKQLDEKLREWRHDLIA